MATSKPHREASLGNIHAPHQWRPVDAAARLALSATEDDVGRYAWQLDDDSEWMLVDHDPVTWKERGAKGADGEDGGTGPAGPEGPAGSVGTIDTDDVTEAGNRYFTEARVRATDLAGLDTTAGTPTSSDTVLGAIGKLIGKLVAHVAGSSDKHAAGDITNSPSGSIAATTVQAAIDELASEKQPLDATLTALAGVTTAADKLIYATGSDAFATSDLTAAGRALLDDTDAAAQRATLGLGSVDNTADSSKPVSTAQAAADAAVLSTAQSYADALVVGLLNDRGNHDASGNTFPSSGGSGSAGAIKKGDLWTISVGGTLGGAAVTSGDVIRAKVDTPGSTAGNWAITENNFGYVAENSANKDVSGGYVGMTLLKINLRNAANTVTSWLATAATSARTWTFPDKDGTVAMTSDITGTNSGTNTGDETANTLGSKTNGATAKSTLVDADSFLASDSADSNNGKKHTWANLKAGILAYIADAATTLANKKLKSPFEITNIVASALTGTVNIDMVDGLHQLRTVNSSANYTLNLRWNSGTSLNTQMAVGDTATFTIQAPNGATPYYMTALQIDGSGVTPKWIGTAPTAGNASKTDIYTVSVTKTASAVYTVIAQMSTAA